MLVCITPLLQCDLRSTFSEVVTCSDASHWGGAVALAESLTSAGQEVASRLRSEDTEPVEAPLLVISAFNGIGGAFRGYDLAGLKPQGLIAIEWDRAAQRVSRKAWPHAQEFGNIEDITLDTVREWANSYPRVTQVHLIGGFPCVHLSSARAGRRNLQGEGSKLFWVLKQLLLWLQMVFEPTALVKFLVENVLSMDTDARAEISRQLQVEPYALCPSDILPYNRPRLAWVNVELQPTEGVRFDSLDGYRRVYMTGPGISDEQWLEEGWRRLDPATPFATFMKSIVRSRPPPQPAGISRCDDECLMRWESDSFRFPPYQYKLCNLVENDDGDRRYLTALERELLLGFGYEHTRSAWAANKVKENKLGFEDKRLSLCGDSFSMLSFGWVIAQLCHPWVPPIDPRLLVSRLGLAPGAGLAQHLSAPIQRKLSYGGPLDPTVKLADLTALVSRQVNHTGSDVSLALGIPFSSKSGNHASLWADWWTWRILFITRWSRLSHINYLEMRMILQAIRWRARYEHSINKRWLHLSDSMVCNYIFSKGRTSSLVLQNLTQSYGAYLLALNSAQFQGHVDSIENPTDGASRQAPH